MVCRAGDGHQRGVPAVPVQSGRPPAGVAVSPQPTSSTGIGPGTEARAQRAP